MAEPYIEMIKGDRKANRQWVSKDPVGPGTKTWMDIKHKQFDSRPTFRSKLAANVKRTKLTNEWLLQNEKLLFIYS